VAHRSLSDQTNLEMYSLGPTASLRVLSHAD
jgi:hypothetical protein